MTISVIGTNDLHGGVVPEDDRGGLALLDGYVRNVRAARAADGGGVLLIDAGDLFQGTLESNLNEGSVVVSAYNALGYTASAVGNHEFDFGPVGEHVAAAAGEDPRGALKARASEARFPFLTANIIDTATGRPVEWPNVRPSTIVEVAGVRVGIVGLATTATLTATLSANTSGLSVLPLAPALEMESRNLRQRGASIVIAAAHAGGECTRFDNPSDLSSCVASSEIFEVARALPPGAVDLIVAGHRHEGIAHVVAGIPIMSSYSRGRYFGRVDLAVDRATGRVRSHQMFPPHEICAREDSQARCVPSGEGVPSRYEGREVKASPEIEAILAPAVARADELKWMPLNADVVDTFERGSRTETSLGSLVADWVRLSAGTDAAIVNSGGIRADLPAGPITYGHLYEVMPFDNIEVVISMTGAELRRIIENNLHAAGSMLLLSGLRATAICSGSDLTVAVSRTSGTRVRDDEAISVATQDFLATGGDGFFQPIMPLRIIRGVDGGPVQRERIASWIKDHGGRWRSADFTGGNRRIVYTGTRPVTCSNR